MLAQALDAGEVLDAAVASSGAQRAAWWEVRHSVSEGNKKAGMGINTDPRRAGVRGARVHRAGHRRPRTRILPGVPIIVVAHLGDGNVHFIPLGELRPVAPLRRRRRRRALRSSMPSTKSRTRCGGTFSAEHGIGQVLTEEMALFKPAVEIDLMRGIKRLLDPHDLFNPGRLLPARSHPPQRPPVAKELP